MTTLPKADEGKFSSAYIEVIRRGTMSPLERIRFGRTFDNYVTCELDVQDSRSPFFEAQGLIALLGKGDTADDIRQLIAVPRDVEATLRAFIQSNPEESSEIESALLFRRRVAEEFERLLSM